MQIPCSYHRGVVKTTGNRKWTSLRSLFKSERKSFCGLECDRMMPVNGPRKFLVCLANGVLVWWSTMIRSPSSKQHKVVDLCENFKPSSCSQLKWSQDLMLKSVNADTCAGLPKPSPQSDLANCFEKLHDWSQPNSSVWPKSMARSSVQKNKID